MRELIYTDIVPKKIYIAKSFLASGIDANTSGIVIDKFIAGGGFYNLRATIQHPGGHCTDCDLGIEINLASPGNDPEMPDMGPEAFEYLNYSLSGNYYTFTNRDDDNYDYGQTTGSIEETNDYIIITLSDEFLEAIGDASLSDYASIGSGVFFTNDEEELEEPTPEPEPSDFELIELTSEDFVSRIVELNDIPRNFYFKEKTSYNYLFLIRTTTEGDDYFTVNELDALGLHTFDDWDLPQILDRDVPDWRDTLEYHLFLDLSKDINGLCFSLELWCHNADEIISQITPGEREWTEDDFNFLIDTFDIGQIGYHVGDEPQSNIFISVNTYNYNGEDYVHFKLEDPYIDVLNRLGVSEEMGYHWIYDVEEGPLYFSESDPTPEPEPEPEPTPVEPVIKSNYALIADSIRAKTGKTALMTAAQMPDEIASIPSGDGFDCTELPIVVSERFMRNSLEFIIYKNRETLRALKSDWESWNPGYRERSFSMNGNFTTKQDSQPAGFYSLEESYYLIHIEVEKHEYNDKGQLIGVPLGTIDINFTDVPNITDRVIYDSYDYDDISPEQIMSNYISIIETDSQIKIEFNTNDYNFEFYANGDGDTSLHGYEKLISVNEDPGE